MVTHNNSSKLDNKFGALPPGRDIPNQKSDDLELLHLNALKILKCDNTNCDNNDNKNHDDMCHLDRLKLKLRTSNDNTAAQDTCLAIPLRLRGGGESSLSTGTSGWGTPPSQQASNNNGKHSINI